MWELNVDSLGKVKSGKWKVENGLAESIPRTEISSQKYPMKVLLRKCCPASWWYSDDNLKCGTMGTITFLKIWFLRWRNRKSNQITNVAFPTVRKNLHLVYWFSQFLQWGNYEIRADQVIVLQNMQNTTF